MRICQLSHVESSLYFVAPLVEALLAEGHDVVAACTLDKDGREVRRHLGGTAVDRVRVARRITPGALTTDVLALAAYLRRGEFDVLHVHSPLVSMQGRLAARLAGTPVAVYTAHGFYFHDGMGAGSRVAHRALEGLFCRALTDYVVTVNAEDTDVARRWLRRHPERVVPIHGVGVDTTRFAPGTRADRERVRQAFGVGPEDVVIAFVGRWVREKGIVELARAFADLSTLRPQARLWVMGELHPTERDKAAWPHACALLAAGVDDGRVRVLGHQDDVRPFLQAADVFALPSYREGMPIALLEAMSCALAVVTTDVRGCREAVLADDSGLLVPPRDHAALSAALAAVVDDDQLRNRLGHSARRRVVETFAVGPSVQTQLELYRRIAQDLARQPCTPRHQRSDTSAGVTAGRK